ncbi:MAG: hypothetical protein AB8F94_28275 [Saprospiraceae bacterium]
MKISDFTLQDVGILETSMNIEPSQIGQDQVTQFIHQVGIGHEIDLEKKVLFINVDVDIKRGDTDNIIAKFKTSISFGFGHLNLEFDTSDSKFPFSKKLTHQLTDAAMSTTRGMMFMYLKGTILHKAYLPLIDFSNVEIPVRT